MKNEEPTCSQYLSLHRILHSSSFLFYGIMTVVYEDNHSIIVNKTAAEIVQGDKTGDIPLSETVKQYLKEKYSKPGNVFLYERLRLQKRILPEIRFCACG